MTAHLARPSHQCHPAPRRVRRRYQIARTHPPCAQATRSQTRVNTRRIQLLWLMTQLIMTTKMVTKLWQPFLLRELFTSLDESADVVRIAPFPASSRCSTWLVGLAASRLAARIIMVLPEPSGSNAQDACVFELRDVPRHVNGPRTARTPSRARTGLPVRPAMYFVSIAGGQRGIDGNTGQLFIDDAEGALEADALIVRIRDRAGYSGWKTHHLSATEGRAPLCTVCHMLASFEM